jgi:uncharacterized membrane-anchored protein
MSQFDAMDESVATAALKPHPLRDKLLAEAHARPFHAAATPTQFYHFAWASDADQNEHHTEGLTALCRSHGAPRPPPGARHHYVDFRTVGLRWEQHAEFTTYTWEFRKSGSRRQALEWMNRALTSDGHLVSIDLRLEDRADEAQLGKNFDASSLAMSFVSTRLALAATDFRADN